MKDFVDLHTHTIASGHAFNTIDEMIRAAADKETEIFGITEHAPAMDNTCSSLYFKNLRVMPRKKMGITVLYGAELNILDFDGNVDLEEEILREMDVTVASMHWPIYNGGTREENTGAYLNAMKNPYVNIIGHPNDGAFPVDYKILAQGAKEYGVLLEVNNAALSPNGFRLNFRENCKEMLRCCKEYQTPIIVDSDAHVYLDVANHSLAMELLKEVEFPEELVVNFNLELVKKYLNYYKR